jgi:hypothetical protein
MEVTSFDITHDIYNSCQPLIYKREGEGKVVPVLFLTEHDAMKAYWGSGDIAPRIL